MLIYVTSPLRPMTYPEGVTLSFKSEQSTRISESCAIPNIAFLLIAASKDLRNQKPYKLSRSQITPEEMLIGTRLWRILHGFKYVCTNI